MVTVEEAAANFARRNAARAEADLAAEKDALEKLPALVELLSRNGAQRITLFGSLAEGRFRSDSDIDLATEGLHWRAALRLFAECAELAKRQVDILCIEDAPPSLVERIRESGRPLT